MYFEEKVVYFLQLVLYFEQVLHLMSKSYISEKGGKFSSTSFIFRTLKSYIWKNKSYIFKKEVLYFHETSHIFRRTR